MSEGAVIADESTLHQLVHTIVLKEVFASVTLFLGGVDDVMVELVYIRRCNLLCCSLPVLLLAFAIVRIGIAFALVDFVCISTVL